MCVCVYSNPRLYDHPLKSLSVQSSHRVKNTPHRAIPLYFKCKNKIPFQLRLRGTTSQLQVEVEFARRRRARNVTTYYYRDATVSCAMSSRAAALSAPPAPGAGRAILRFADGTKSQTVTEAKRASASSEGLVISCAGERATPELYTAPAPTRDASGAFHFSKLPADVTHAFTPNMSPEEVLRAGSFGGYYFRTIASGVTGFVYENAWRELPPAWLAGLSPKSYAAQKYNAAVNKFGVKSGLDLAEWEESTWISKLDPFGWFQWYCRFFQGRRSWDDARQISRWSACAGEKGRWKNNLIAKCVKEGAAFDDKSVSPVVRQTLQHWAYTLTQADFMPYAKKVRAGASTSFVGKVVKTAGGDAGADAGAAVAGDGPRKRKRGQ